RPRVGSGEIDRGNREPGNHRLRSLRSAFLLRELRLPAIEIGLHAAALAGTEVEDRALAAILIAGGGRDDVGGGAHGPLRLRLPRGRRGPLDARRALG